MQVSVQDVRAPESDRIAGLRSFERKIEVARLVKELRLPLTLNVVLHRENLDRVPEIIGLAESPAEIDQEVVRRMLDRYAERLPLIDGAVDAVARLAESFRLALASSSNRPVIDAFPQPSQRFVALSEDRMRRGDLVRTDILHLGERHESRDHLPGVLTTA